MIEGLGLPVRPGSAGISAGRLLPHVLEATGHVQRLHVVPDRAIYLLTIVASNLRDIGQLDTSRPPLDRAHAIAQAQLGPDHPSTLTIRHNLAYILGEAGQPWTPTDFVDTYIMPLAPLWCQFRARTRMVTDTPALSVSAYGCSTPRYTRRLPASHARGSSTRAGG